MRFALKDRKKLFPENRKSNLSHKNCAPIFKDLIKPMATSIQNTINVNIIVVSVLLYFKLFKCKECKK